MPCHHRPPPPKTAPSNKQNDNVAILARVPAISSVFFYFSFVCAKTRVHPHILPASITKRKQEQRGLDICASFRLTTKRRSQVKVSSFQQDAELQFTCFQIQFYLRCSFAPFQSRTPLSISKHFAIRAKFLLKASFYALLETTFYHYLGGCILSHFLLSSSHFPLHSEKKTYFRIQIDLQLNFIQIIRSSLQDEEALS